MEPQAKPILALNQKDAAAALSISVPTFRDDVRPHLKPVYIAGATRYRVTDLQQWLDQETARADHQD